jgi:subtilase family serine protease
MGQILSVLAATLLIATAQLLAADGLARSSTVSPLVVVGPRALPSVAAASTNYGLFTCQVVGQNADGVCYDPYQIRRAYHIEPLIRAGFNGGGKTIVIIDAFQSPNIVEQLNTFDTFYGLPGLNGLGGSYDRNLGTFRQIAPDGLTPFVAGNADMTGWAGEISLDVLWAHSIAPGANIVLVLAKSDQDPDILSATKYAVDHRLGDVISQSFGENESCVDPAIAAQQHQVFVDATLQGITLFASSGDSGAGQLTCDGSSLVKAVSNPAVDSLVTAVGGTELHAAAYCLEAAGCNPAANPVAGTYEGEIAWNEPSIGASGGGFSVLVDEPVFQRATVKGRQRGLPDVSYNAAELHGVLVYLNIPGLPAGFYLFGGTSSGSPQWAALLAITDQRAGYHVGFINQALYRIVHRRSHHSSPFFDITTGNNSFADIVGFNAGSGWDPVTGFGSPKASHLVDELIETVTPLDGFIGILESGPHAGGFHTGPKRVRPH